MLLHRDEAGHGKPEKEFWYYIKQLNNYRVKHTKVKKRKLVYWDRLFRPIH